LNRLAPSVSRALVAPVSRAAYWSSAANVSYCSLSMCKLCKDVFGTFLSQPCMAATHHSSKLTRWCKLGSTLPDGPCGRDRRSGTKPYQPPVFNQKTVWFRGHFL